MSMLQRSFRTLFALLMMTVMLGSLFTAVQPISAAPAQSPGNISLAGVHWYSGTSSMLDFSLPAGQRGWDVEYISNVGSCDGNPGTDPEGVRDKAQRAKNDGLVNIIRVDYAHPLAVPRSADAAWADNYIKCTQELSDLSSIYIVGNEPNLDDGGGADISAQEYATAFNYLYSRKGEMPAGTELLAVFNAPFNPTQWMHDMTVLLNNADGFAFHTGGARPTCQDPRVACSYGGWSFDGGFRYYRDVINNIDSRLWSKPVYITEFNTYTGPSCAPPCVDDHSTEPANNYPTDWINNAFADVRNYNANRGSKPLVKALAWFVDENHGSWGNWSLTNPDPDLARARTDMGEEFKNVANRPGGSSPTATPTRTPTPVPTGPPLNVHLDVFVRGTDNNIYHRWQFNSNWSAWDPMGAPPGGATSDPSAVSWGNGRIDLFVRGGYNPACVNGTNTNALYHRAYANGSWGGWECLGGILVTGPDAAAWGVGHMDIFLAGVNNVPWRLIYNNGSWAWEQVPDGSYNYDPGAVSPSANRVDLFARGMDGNLYHKPWTGGWGVWEPMGGPIASGPDAASWGSGHLDVFARKSDNNIYHRWQLNSGWSNWEPLGAPPGGATSDPSVVSPAVGRIDLFVRGGYNPGCVNGTNNNALYHKAFFNGSWGTTWECMGGVLTSSPDAASWSLH